MKKLFLNLNKANKKILKYFGDLDLLLIRDIRDHTDEYWKIDYDEYCQCETLTWNDDKEKIHSDINYSEEIYRDVIYRKDKFTMILIKWDDSNRTQEYFVLDNSKEVKDE